jgi:hypothetical protein
MHNTKHQWNEPRFQPVPVATARQRSRSHIQRQARASPPRRRRWVLVHVWDGAVLAAFDDEASARTVLSCVDDDDVVVLSVDT